MKKWNNKNIITYIATMILVGACSSSQRQVEFAKRIELPVETKTRVTDYLACFGDMLTAYRTKGTELDLLRLAVISAKDATDVSTVAYRDSEIPSDFKDTTLGLISRIGGPVRIIHIPKSKEIFDAVRYGSIPCKKLPFLNIL